MADQPNLGYGKQSEATIDQANIAMRGMPWYQQMMRSFGQDPGHPTLNDAQRQQVLRGAQANGFVVDEGNMEMDDHGNFNPVGHKLRNTLIVAGVAAATIATMGAAGAFAGAAGAGGAAGTGAGAGAGLAGVEGGAYGVGSGALAGLGTGAMGAAGAGGAAAAAGAGAAGAEGAFGADGVFTGASTYGGAAGTGASGIGKYLSAAGDVSDALGGLEGGRAAGRLAETNANSQYDRATQDQYRTQVAANENENSFGISRAKLGLDTSTAENNFGISQANTGIGLSDADLRQKQFALTAPGARAHNAVRGDILSSAQDVSIGGLPKGITVPTISGGLRPSMFTAPTKQLGTDMTAQAAAGQAAGDHFAPLPALPQYHAPTAGLPDYKANPLAPGVTPPVGASGVDSVLNTAGTVGTLASLLAKYYR